MLAGAVQELRDLRSPGPAPARQLELFGGAGRHRVQQRVLVLEVAVHAHRPHVELLGQAAHAQAGHALLLDQTARSGENPLLRQLLLARHVRCIVRCTRTGGGMGTSRLTVRALAWAALAGQVLFTAAWIVAGALEPGYSHLREGVSAAGAKDSLHPWIVNSGIIVLGATIVALGIAVARVLPRRPARTVAGLLFAGAGVAFALGGVFKTDCSF